jgi:pilus assembly protein CpaB
MSKKVTIIIAIVCGIIGTVGIISVNKPKGIKTAYKDIVVAAENLREGAIFEESMIAKKSILEEYVAPEAIEWNNRQILYGQKQMIPVVPKGAQISLANLAEAINEEFEYNIPKEYRALSINVSRSTGVSGLLRPGSHVDIIGMFAKTIEAGNITPATAIQVLLQNVSVLAAGQSTTSLSSNLSTSRFGDSSSYSTITVAVTLEEAEMLIAASARGTLYCVLRNPATDSRPVEVQEKTLNEALSGAAISNNNNNRFESQKK